LSGFYERRCNPLAVIKKKPQRPSVMFSVVHVLGEEKKRKEKKKKKKKEKESRKERKKERHKYNCFDNLVGLRYHKFAIFDIYVGITFDLHSQKWQTSVLLSTVT
jgi:hypothetical protein